MSQPPLEQGKHRFQLGVEDNDAFVVQIPDADVVIPDRYDLQGEFDTRKHQTTLRKRIQLMFNTIQTALADNSDITICKPSDELPLTFIQTIIFCDSRLRREETRTAIDNLKLPIIFEPEKK